MLPFSPFFTHICARTQNNAVSNAVSAVADEVWQNRTGGNLTIFDKDRDTMETDREQLKFLQPSMGVCYDCYVQLVAIRRS